MDRQRGRYNQQAAIDELKRRNLWGYVEPILTMGSAVIAEPVSGMAGLAALPYGSEAATRAINRTQEAMTYRPRTQEGDNALKIIGELFEPVGDAFIGASEYLGDAAYDATGSPTLGAAAYSVPTMALEALGLKGASKLSKGQQAYEVGDIGSQASRIGGKQRGIFAGVKAKGADLDAMEAAKELQRRGVSRDEIWQKTGWFEDVDGAWKWEIDDSGARLTQKGAQDAYFGDVSGAVDHPVIYQNYDDLGDIAYSAQKGQQGGTYTPFQDRGPDLFPIDEQIEVSRLTDTERLSTSLHEGQHAIQRREGFASGGTPYDFADEVKAAQAEVGRVNTQLSYISQNIEKLKAAGNSEAAEQLAKEYQKVMDYKLKTVVPKAQADTFDLYQRLAGEAEARNVQTRLDYTPEQRRATPPWETLDVPENELIIRR